jgi:hypothetical protein
MTALEWNTEKELISKYTQVSPLDLLFPFASGDGANDGIQRF